MFYWSPGYKDFVMSVLKDLNSCQHQHHILQLATSVCVYITADCVYIYESYLFQLLLDYLSGTLVWL